MYLEKKSFKLLWYERGSDEISFLWYLWNGWEYQIWILTNADLNTSSVSDIRQIIEYFLPLWILCEAQLDEISYIVPWFWRSWSHVLEQDKLRKKRGDFF